MPVQEGRSVVTPEIAAEAAVWVARLHGPDRSIRMERECLDWQARSGVHRLAFERCTDTWQDVACVTLSTYAMSTPVDRGRGSMRTAWTSKRRRWAAPLTALTALALSGVLVLHPWPRAENYSTGVGEQQLVVLGDGSRMTLNTATRVRVELTPAQRTVNVQSGEALFEVAKDAHRPFVVQAAGTEVVATGTAFDVRLTPGRKGANEALAVTLVEGHVVVRRAADGARMALAHPILMAPGERLRLNRVSGAASVEAPRAPTQVDRPHMDQVLAWKRGEAIFDDVPLLDAVAEMNRYSPLQVTIPAAGALGALRVSGQFQTGDSASFARAVATLHGLTLREHSDRLELVAK